MTSQTLELNAINDEELTTANGGFFWKIPLAIKVAKVIAKKATVKTATSAINAAGEIGQHYI